MKFDNFSDFYRVFKDYIEKENIDDDKLKDFFKARCSRLLKVKSIENEENKDNVIIYVDPVTKVRYLACIEKTVSSNLEKIVIKPYGSMMDANKDCFQVEIDKDNIDCLSLKKGVILEEKYILKYDTLAVDLYYEALVDYYLEGNHTDLSDFVVFLGVQEYEVLPDVSLRLKRNDEGNIIVRDEFNSLEYENTNNYSLYELLDEMLDKNIEITAKQKRLNY